jgi:hypothetical protein
MYKRRERNIIENILDKSIAESFIQVDLGGYIIQICGKHARNLCGTSGIGDDRGHIQPPLTCG